jgi:phosphoglycolate phosphatase-like HAD superfamily hydrolase
MTVGLPPNQPTPETGVRLVLFDVDGTLIRTGGAGVRAFGKVFATEFGQLDGFEKLKFAGRTDRSLVREFFGFHNIPATPENFGRFFDSYVFWLDHLLEDARIEICAGVLEFIRGLQELRRPPLLGLLTGNIRLGAEIKLRRVGLWDWFTTGAFADDAEDRGEIAAIARERGSRLLGEPLRPEQVLVVGDTALDIRCARAINARVLAVATGGATLEELRQHQPDWAVPNLTQIQPSTVVQPAGDVPAA